jgi:hypothetical protein
MLSHQLAILPDQTQSFASSNLATRILWPGQVNPSEP